MFDCAKTNILQMWKAWSFKKKNKVLPMRNLRRLTQTIEKKKLEVNQMTVLVIAKMRKNQSHWYVITIYINLDYCLRLS